MNKLISRRLRFAIRGVGAAALVLLGGSTHGIFTMIHTVTQHGAGGPGSLHQAVVDSGPGDTINFSITGEVNINGDLIINKNLFILGPGANKLNVAGHLIVQTGVVTISDLTIGPAFQGVYLESGVLTMNNCAISGNFLSGGIYSALGTTLTMNGCTISGNQLDIQGGAGLQSQGFSTLELHHLGEPFQAQRLDVYSKWSRWRPIE